MIKEYVLANNFTIQNSRAFFQLIDLIKKLETTQELKQVDGNCLVSEFDKGTFPSDIINMLFINPNSHTYYFLACDSYHGGASWEIVSNKEELDAMLISIKSMGSKFPTKRRMFKFFIILLIQSSISQASPGTERHGKEIFIPFCHYTPAPYLAGILPRNFGPFQSDATLIVAPPTEFLRTMDFKGGVEVYDVFGDLASGCGLHAVWQSHLPWLRDRDFVPVGFCSTHHGQPHEDSYLILQKKNAGLAFKIQGIAPEGLEVSKQLIRATVSFSRQMQITRPEESHEVLLRLLIQKAHGEWTPVIEKKIAVKASFERVTWEMALRDIDPGTSIQFDMSVLEENFGTLRLYDARLYGAACYPDFAHPESCL